MVNQQKEIETTNKKRSGRKKKEIYVCRLKSNPTKKSLEIREINELLPLQMPPKVSVYGFSSSF